MGCHSLFQVIFPIQGSNLGLVHCRKILYCLKPRIPIWPSNSVLGICSPKLRIGIQTNTCPWVFRAAKCGNSSNVHEWRTGCIISTQWASVQPCKGMESWHMLPDWWTSIASCWVKEARPRWAHTVWFYLYEMARKENSQTQKAGWQLPGTKSKETREWLLSGYGVSFWDDENVLEFDGGDDCTRFYIFCCCCFVAKSCLTL